MPKRNGTGPPTTAGGPRNGQGQGQGQNGEGSGQKSGGGKGECGKDKRKNEEIKK